MILLFLIASLIFTLLLGARINLLHGTQSANTQVAPRSSLTIIIGLGIIVSLVLYTLGLWNLLSEQLASFVSNHFIITLLAVLCSVVLGFLYLAIAYKIFSKRTLTSNRFLFRNQHEESQSAPSSIDNNPAFEYLSTENEEEKDSAEILENALDLYSIEIRECLIPRKEIVAVEITEEIETVKQTFIESKHSKLIVYDGDIDNIVGYVHHSDFYGAPEKIEDLVSDIPTVPESMTALEMLSFFKKKQKSIAWVVDEFGGTAGILTTEDLLEELFGEIEDEHDESEYIEQQISSNEIILSGRLEVEYINEKFNLNIPTDSAETISGYIIEEQNEIPAKDEKIILGSYEYKILKVSKTKIETIRLKVLEE